MYLQVDDPFLLFIFLVSIAIAKLTNLFVGMLSAFVFGLGYDGLWYCVGFCFLYAALHYSILLIENRWFKTAPYYRVYISSCIFGMSLMINYWLSFKITNELYSHMLDKMPKPLVESDDQIKIHLVTAAFLLLAFTFGMCRRKSKEDEWLGEVETELPDNIFDK